MTTQADVQGWACGLDDVLERLLSPFGDVTPRDRLRRWPRFGRAEPRRRVAAYLQGLLAPVAHKNGWQLAEAVGDRTPDGVRNFLSRVRWDADAVGDDLQDHVVG